MEQKRDQRWSRNQGRNDVDVRRMYKNFNTILLLEVIYLILFYPFQILLTFTVESHEAVTSIPSFQQRHETIERYNNMHVSVYHLIKK